MHWLKENFIELCEEMAFNLGSNISLLTDISGTALPSAVQMISEIRKKVDLHSS